jgi:hypothetical protein
MESGIRKMIINRIKTTDSKMLINNAVMHVEMTRISRGKYTFLIRLGFMTIDKRLPVVVREKKLHIIIPCRRNRA